VKTAEYMEPDVYAALLQRLRLPITAVPHFRGIARAFGVSFDTVFSIYSQEIQYRTISRHRWLQSVAPDYARRFLAGRRGGTPPHCLHPSLH
jgi:hypothetical protein